MPEEESRFIVHPGEMEIVKLGPNATPEMKEAFKRQQEQRKKKLNSTKSKS